MDEKLSNELKPAAGRKPIVIDISRLHSSTFLDVSGEIT
jgi:hypothetical protein